MKTLELKHIAPYLPYGLKVTFEGDDSTHEVVGINIFTEGVDLISPFNDYGQADIEDCRPILRPLSDLTKEIEYNGERFVPVDRLEWNSYDHIIKRGMCDNVGYQYMIKLFEWHFDVFGLHEKNLCVYYNEI